MAEDWLADVKKYEPNADETAVRGIIRHCGIALQKRDSSLVSFSDSTETDRVRENFLKKKLGLTESDSALDAAIAGVGERMKADRTKNRVTVYYLLAEQFGKLDLFGGAAKAAGTGAGVAAAAAAAAAGIGATAAHAGDAVAGTVAAAGATAASAAGSVRGAVDDAASRFADVPEEVAGGGFGRWWPWLLLALSALALFFALKSCMGPQAAVVTNTTDTTVVDNLSSGDGNVSTPEVAATPAPVPTGAGVVAGMRNGLPMLTVYFATAKSDVTPDFDKVAATIKDYVTAHPGTKLAVSGFNDPTGSAAVNAKLSKSRAEAVGAALGKLGIPAGDVSLEKPADTTVSTGSNAEARRVEVTVKQ